MKLSLTLPLGERECPSDYASRLATRTYRNHMRDFCRDFGIDPQAVIDGKPEAIIALADLADVSQEDLLKESFARVGQRRVFLHKGQDLLGSSLTRNQIRMCPACMTEDIERLDCRVAARPHRRSTWMIRGVRTCNWHGMALAEIGKLEAPGVTHDSSRAIADAIHRLPSLVDGATVRAPSPFEHYLVRRIEGGASKSWLSDLPLYAALHFCFVAGAVALHGPAVTLDNIDADEAWGCEAAGFNVADRGAEGIREFLNELQAPFRNSRSSAGPKVMYGRLYDWLAHDCRDRAYDPLREIIVDHSLDTLALGPGDVLFGRDVGARRLHSVRTAAQEFSIHPKRLRKALERTGLAAEGSDRLINHRVVADPEQVAALVKELKQTMNLTAARIYLNVPRPHDEGLAKSGLLKPMIEKPRGRSGMHYTFRREDLDAFLEKLLEKADPALGGDPAFETLLKAAKRCCCAVMDVVRLVVDGKLARVGRNPAEQGFMSVLVDANEVRPHVTGPDYDGFSLRDLEKLLSSGTYAVKALVEKGLLTTVTVKNPMTGWIQPIVRKEELERYRREYVSLHALARERGEHFARVKKALVVSGVFPIGDPEELKQTLYRRSDIPPEVSTASSLRDANPSLDTDATGVSHERKTVD
ncbi:TniQ family protein [Mesorhizobium kowhaii]|uniref:TniQ family protein n=1 Tax=Mesorhizobium kowhaii TaxID=1300272 RepID=UPI0035EA3406